MIKKIKNFFTKIYNDLSSTYIPYFKVLFNNILIFLVALFAGVLLGRLTTTNNNNNNSSTVNSNSITLLSSVGDIELEEKEYVLLPVLPYNNGNNYNYDFSNGSIIISKHDNYDTHLDIMLPTLSNEDYVYYNTTIATNSFVDIAMLSGELGYYNNSFQKTFRIVINYSVDDWFNKFDSIQRYGYFYDVYDGLNYNTVYNFYSGETKIASLYFLDTELIPYFNYDSITNLLFSTNRISSLNVNDLIDSVYQRGYNAGYDAGYGVSYDLGYNVGYNAGNLNGYNIGYDAGYTVGYANGYDNGIIGESPFDSILNGVSTLLDIKLFGTVSIGNLLMLGITIILFGALMKVFRF